MRIVIKMVTKPMALKAYLPLWQSKIMRISTVADHQNIGVQEWVPLTNTLFSFFGCRWTLAESLSRLCTVFWKSCALLWPKELSLEMPNITLRPNCFWSNLSVQKPWSSTGWQILQIWLLLLCARRPVLSQAPQFVVKRKAVSKFPWKHTALRLPFKAMWSFESDNFFVVFKAFR